MRCCPLFQSQGPADFRCSASVHFLPYHAEGLPESMLGTCSVWKETPGLR
jgi:hypothetical protein